MATLAQLAMDGKLVIYVGAGLSRSEPTTLPTGPEVARLTYARLSAVISPMPECDEDDITSLADAVAALPGGPAALRHAVVHVADFTTAEPNYGHRILSYLLLEGAVTVHSTNWDDCIERSVSAERIHVILTQSDRIQVADKALLKMHGCATRTDTLLISTTELLHPPDWVLAEMRARLVDSHVVFVGIGDVAGYVIERIREVQQVLPPDHIRVVSPSIVSEWTSSNWASTIPHLPAENRIELTADELLDGLAGAYVALVLEELRVALVSEIPLIEALERVRVAFAGQTPLFALRWIRGAAVRPPPGRSVLRTVATTIALLALGLIGKTGLLLRDGGAALANGENLQLLIAVTTTPIATLERQARYRLQAFLNAGGSGDDAPAFLLAGGVGSLPTSSSLPRDILETGSFDDVVDGQMNISPRVIDADEVVKRG